MIDLLGMFIFNSYGKEPVRVQYDSLAAFIELMGIVNS